MLKSAGRAKMNQRQQLTERQPTKTRALKTSLAFIFSLHDCADIHADSYSLFVEACLYLRWFVLLILTVKSPKDRCPPSQLTERDSSAHCPNRECASVSADLRTLPRLPRPRAAPANHHHGRRPLRLYQFLETATFGTDNRVNSMTAIW